MKKFKNLIFIILFLILEFYLLYDSKDVVNSFNKTLNICLYTLMPTMFLSILFSQVLINLQFEKYIPKFIINFFSYLFKINPKDVIIFMLSIISGYPNNAKMLNNNSNLNTIINFTNFVNPIFLICTVGAIYLKDIHIIILIFLSHILTNIIIGIILRNKYIYNKYTVNNNTNIDFFKVYYNSLKVVANSLVLIFSNILFFSVLISLLSNILPFNNIINSLLIGIVEFSNGIYLISNLNIDIFLKGLLIIIIITFGSFSVHMQMISINEKIKYTKYLLYRILSIFISIILYLIFYYLFY